VGSRGSTICDKGLSVLNCVCLLVKLVPVRLLWAGIILCWMACGPGAMSRSELLFWAVGLAIFVLSEIVIVVTSHNRHSPPRGYITPSIIQYGLCGVMHRRKIRFSRDRPFSAIPEALPR
jgi:hypothetical protein